MSLELENAMLRAALENIKERVDFASDFIHDSKRWHEEEFKGMTLYDWIFKEAKEALNPSSS